MTNNILALKACAPGFRSHISPRIKYPSEPGKVIRLSRHIFEARYPKAGRYGLHCFGGDWHLIERLPDVLWRTDGGLLECCLVLELRAGEYRVGKAHRRQIRVEPWSFVDVLHITTWRATVRYAGTFRECQAWGSVTLS